MASSSFDQPKRLVDMEFKPGELPPADTQPVSDAYQAARWETRHVWVPAAWLALLAATSILILIVGNATVTFAANALREGSIVDLTLLLALIVLVGVFSLYACAAEQSVLETQVSGTGAQDCGPLVQTG